VILGIDPGPTESAFCFCHGYEITESDKVATDELIRLINMAPTKLTVVIENIQCYGMAVGRETFDTCINIGRFIQECRRMGHKDFLYPRPEYMRSILGAKAPKGKADSMLWQALKLRFGGDKKGEPLYLLKGASDKRSAYAVAVYHLDINGGKL
jgi:hypothetical protein